MKKILLVPASVLITLLATGQTTQNEPVKATQTIEQLAVSSPEEYTAIKTYAAQNGTYVTALPKGKDARLDGTVTPEQVASNDPFTMGLTIQSVNQYFRIEGTEQMLVVKSLYTLQQEMKTKN